MLLGTWLSMSSGSSWRLTMISEVMVSANEHIEPIHKNATHAQFQGRTHFMKVSLAYSSINPV